MPRHRKQPPEWRRDTQCTGKHPFDDSRIARKVARQMSRRREVQASAYRCSDCGKWHVGTTAINRRKRAEEERWRWDDD